MPAPDLKSLFEGILTTQGLQAQQQAQEQQALQYYAQQSDRPWQFLLERSLNQAGAALPNSIQNQQKAQAAANEEVIKRSTARYGQMVQEGADPGKAQLDVLDSAISEFAKQGNYEAISSLAPTYLALQSKQAELAKLNQQTKTEYAQQQKAETETALAPVLADEKIQTGQSTRTLQSKQGQKIDAELAKTEGMQIVDLTQPDAGPVVASVDPKTRQATITNAEGITKVLKPGQYKEVSTKGGEGGRAMPPKVAGEIQAAGKNLDASDELVQTFDPSFGGYKAKEAGDAALSLKRNIFGDNKGAAEWWAKYEAKTQEVRHGLYGSSFTKNEQEQWEKQAISPGMRPEVIQKRLEAQRAIEQKVAERVAKGYSFDYNPDQIEAFMGRPVAAIKAPGKQPSDNSSPQAEAGSYDYVPGKGLVPKK